MDPDTDRYSASNAGYGSGSNEYGSETLFLTKYYRHLIQKAGLCSPHGLTEIRLVSLHGVIQGELADAEDLQPEVGG